MRQRRSWPGTAGGRSRRSATICEGSSSGLLTTASTFSGRPAPTSNCSAPGWRNVAWRRRRSTVGCRQCAASTASPTSTAASAPTLPSTSAARRSTPATPEGSTAPSSACSYSPPSSSTETTLAVLLGLNGLRVSEACATNIEDLGLERGHRILSIVGKGNKPAKIPPRPAHGSDDRLGRRRASRGSDPATSRRPTP